MSEVKLEDDVKQELVTKIKNYFVEELDQDIGSFEAEFLIDFFSSELGKFYYNQGLADALSAFEGKIEEFSDIIFQLEKE